MGHSRLDKAETHDRIVRIAAQRFREVGIDGLSVADLMKEAGLTVGGFYKHFESRDALVAEAILAAVTDAEAGTARPTVGQAGLAAYVGRYLSEAHRDAPGQGCSLAALSSEAARHDGAARTVLADHAEHNFQAVAAALDPASGGNPAAGDRRQRAILTVSAMVGALVLARLIEDPTRSREVLASVAQALKGDLASG